MYIINPLEISISMNTSIKFVRGLCSLHQVVFDKKAPRLSKEYKVNIQPVVKWFGDELFTYIRVFGSTSTPHVLPWYFLDKLLAREISYQTVSKGVTRYLREF